MHDPLFRALADPTRRRILELLAEREGQHIRYRLNTTVLQEIVRYLLTRFAGGSDA